MRKYDKISIIIPSDGRYSLRDTLASILANQTNEILEIIVVGILPEGGIAEDPRIRFLPACEQGTGALRNLAVREAHGSLLLFTDSDCIVDPDWIDQACASVSANRPVVGGGIRFPEDNTWDLGDNLAIFYRMHVTRHPGPVGTLLGTNNLAITRQVFIETGGFRDDLTVGEDWEFLNRARAAGHLLYFNPTMAVLHNSGRDTAAKVRQHAEWYGRGYVILMKAAVIARSPLRMDRLIADVPGGAIVWSAIKATLHVISIYGSHPHFLRYRRAWRATWLFAYARRKTIIAELHQSSL